MGRVAELGSLDHIRTYDMEAMLHKESPGGLVSDRHFLMAAHTVHRCTTGSQSSSSDDAHHTVFHGDFSRYSAARYRTDLLLQCGGVCSVSRSGRLWLARRRRDRRRSECVLPLDIRPHISTSRVWSLDVMIHHKWSNPAGGNRRQRQGLALEF